MKWVRDRTGRFVLRPHYEPAELEAECERVIREFLTRRRGAPSFPVLTDDLIALLEQRTDDLDLYADLSGEGESVEGMTVFEGGKPSVSISRDLSEDARRSNRLRTTLTHEFGHVHFHSCLFVGADQPTLFDDEAPGVIAPPLAACHRETIIEAKPTDWMEWQAGYVCGAILMPESELLAPVRAMRSAEQPGPPTVQSAAGISLVTDVARAFQTSLDAARVRLTRLGHLVPDGPLEQARLLK